MKINRLIQKNSKQYIIEGESKSLLFYTETILKYNLLNKKELTDDVLEEINNYDNYIKIYYDAVLILKRKRKTEKEITHFFLNKGLKQDLLNEFIIKLKNANLLNDEAYLSAFIHDEVYLKKHGPLKIEKDLMKLGFNSQKIQNEQAKIDESVWRDIIKKYITKKINSNRNYSEKVLKQKIIANLKLNGFYEEQIIKELDSFKVDDYNILKHEFYNQNRILEKKYSDHYLKDNIRKKLLQKGFLLEDINELLEE